MDRQKETYFKQLSVQNLGKKPVEELLDVLKTYLDVECVPPELLERSNSQAKITEKLSRLGIYIAKGRKSWGGLVIPFPGSTNDLTTEKVGTPYIREILYPMLDLHRRVQDYYQETLPCLYILGARFPDVFIRKFKLIGRLIPHVIVLTSDLLNDAQSSKNFLNSTGLTEKQQSGKEARVQSWLCNEMSTPNGLIFPVEDGEIRIGYLGREIRTGEGTKEPERLDILGYDQVDHSLIAIEVKGPDCQRVQLENLFLQGFEHREWLERNKMAVKFLFDGPNGIHIDTRRRVRLVLGSFAEKVPDLFQELRHQAMKQDEYLRIDFLRLLQTGDSNGNLLLKRF